jgi:protein-S-isoprenylcysteine O-methyltransferase Ste14
MSLIPVFEIGVWNAWIFTVFTFVHIFLVAMVLRKDVGQKMDHGEEEQRKLTMASIFWFALFLYSVFLPLKLGTAWLYTGLALYIVGTVFLTLFFVDVAATPAGEPFTRGIYRYSRNPMYVGMFLQFIGIGIASASWLFLLITLAMVVPMWLIVIVEERSCLEKFGDAYREYMNKTPRWLGILKS